MKIRIFMAALIVCLNLHGTMGLASEPAASESKCPGDVGQVQDSSGICADPKGTGIGIGIGTPSVPETSLPLLLPSQSALEHKEDRQAPLPTHSDQSKEATYKTIVYFFWGKGCPHCEKEKQFLEGLKNSQPSLDIRRYEVWYDKTNAAMMSAMLRSHGVRPSGVPLTFIHDQVFSGFSAQTRELIEQQINECRTMACGDPAEQQSKIARSQQPVVQVPVVPETPAAAKKMEPDPSVTIPFLGPLDVRKSSLPVLTLVIAGMDSFNPCAFFVLLSLLGLLVHARSRNKMLSIGGVFVFFSGFIYFLFMAAWLNLFLIMGNVAIITVIAGCISVIIAVINIKDFFLYKQGISLTIPDSAKPKLFDRMRKLLRSTSFIPILIGTTVLAIVANSYELLCTAGFPMVFTRILTLNNLPITTYYLYLVLYNIIYVIPLLVIVLGFTYTLGKQQLSEWQGRVLKLVSGCMMLGLGGILLVNPVLLNSVIVSFIILLSALVASLLVATVTRRLGY